MVPSIAYALRWCHTWNCIETIPPPLPCPHLHLHVFAEGRLADCMLQAMACNTVLPTCIDNENASARPHVEQTLLAQLLMPLKSRTVQFLQALKAASMSCQKHGRLSGKSYSEDLLSLPGAAPFARRQGSRASEDALA